MVNSKYPNGQQLQITEKPFSETGEEPEEAEVTDLFLKRTIHIKPRTGNPENCHSYTVRKQTSNCVSFLREVFRIMGKKRCSWSDACLNYHTPERFTRCFWQDALRVKTLWLFYRITIAIFFIFSWICSILHIGREVPRNDALKYPIFLTNWTFTIETLQFFLALVIVTEKAMKEEKVNYDPQIVMNKMPWHYQLYWVLYTITLSASVVVTVIFWTSVFKPGESPFDFLAVSTHLLNSLLMILDFFLNGHPLKFWHIYFPAIYGLIYSIFTVIYQKSGGTGPKGKIPIYGIVDWDKPLRTTITCVIALMFLLLMHILFWSLHILKKKIRKRRATRSNEKTIAGDSDPTVAGRSRHNDSNEPA